MKFSPFLVGCAAIAVLSQTALAWTNEDHEIFDIVSALETAEGKGTTFYSFLNVTKSATEKEISKSYKRRSLELHPDKNPNDKSIEDRFARLGVISGILRDAEKRARYDHFYENGVPRWRGTGYYYSRYRPGLGTVLIGMTLFSCGVHYFILIMQWGLNVQRIRAFQQQALELAWGPSKKPLAGKRRIRVKTGDAPGPGIPGVAGGRPTKPGQTLEMIIEGEKVYLVENGEEILLDEDAAVLPSFSETWIPKFIHSTYLKAIGQAPIKTADSASDDDAEVVVDAKGKETVIRKPRGPAKGIEGSGKIGGRRRVVKPKRPEA